MMRLFNVIKSYSRTVEDKGVFVETIKSQQMKVKRAISIVFEDKIPKHWCSIKLKLVPQMRNDMFKEQKHSLRNAMNMHRQVLNNIVELEVLDVENIDKPIGTLENKTMRELIMNIESKEGDKLYAAIESVQGRLVLWTKLKFKAKAEMHSSHMVAWLIRMCGKSATSMLTKDKKNRIKNIVWIKGLPWYPEELDRKENMINTISIDNQGPTGQKTSKTKRKRSSFQNTTDAAAGGSQSVRGYGMPLALT